MDRRERAKIKGNTSIESNFIANDKDGGAQRDWLKCLSPMSSLQETCLDGKPKLFYKRPSNLYYSISLALTVMCSMCGKLLSAEEGRGAIGREMRITETPELLEVRAAWLINPDV